MADLAKKQQQSFEDRIGRIRTGVGDNLTGTIHVGPRDEVRAKDTAKARKRDMKRRRSQMRKLQRDDARSSGRTSFKDVLLFPVGLLVGAVAFAAGRAGAFHFLTPEGRFPIDISGFAPPVPLMLWADVALATVVAVILAWMFHLGFGLRRLGVLLGFAAMMSAEPLAVEQAPDLWAMAYSEGYVRETLARPDPLKLPDSFGRIGLVGGIAGNDFAMNGPR